MQDKSHVQHSYTVPFFAIYFIYYSAYCIFSSFIIPYLTDRGYSAGLCGAITSLSLLANLLMELAGGYITDTFLTTRRYLTICIFLVTALCTFCTFFADRLLICMIALVLTAGIVYPFSQLMDAWVNCSRELDPNLVYSRVRAGGSIGFAIASVAAGWFFEQNGWESYFLVQAILFLVMLPLLGRLPEVELGNSSRRAGNGGTGEMHLSPLKAFKVAAGNRRYMFALLITSLYWFSHRPVGSYLSLIIQDRGGGAATYGLICGAGAAAEFAALLALASLTKANRLSFPVCMAAALLSDLARPLCLLLIPGMLPVCAGQILQSCSFAFFYSAGVECFTRTADPRIRSFSISMGLTVSSVVGTAGANLLGGWLCDRLGTDSLVILSLAVALFNCGVLLAGGRDALGQDA